MLRFVQLTEADKESYNMFVANSGNGSFLQSWEWGDWNVRQGRTVSRFSIENENGMQVGAAQFIHMPLPMGKYYVYAPYGPVLQVGQTSDVNVQFIFRELKVKFPGAMFVRIEPTFKSSIFNQKFLKKSTNIQPAITMVVDIAKSDDELLAGMHPKTRYNIKLAEKQGVEVRIISSDQTELVEKAVELILQTQVRQKFRGHSEKYYEEFLQFFGKHTLPGHMSASLLGALYQGQLLAAGVMVDFGSTRTYLFGGSSDLNRNVMAPYLLHFAAMGQAREKGMPHYDLGGSEVASGGERGFTRFKKGFGGRVVEYAGAYDFVFSKLTYAIYGIMRILNRLLK